MPSVAATLSSHRQRMPVYGDSGAAPRNGYVDTTPHRAPLGAIDPNIYRSGAGYGLSAGMKMGRQQGGSGGHTGVGMGIGGGTSRGAYGGLGAR